MVSARNAEFIKKYPHTLAKFGELPQHAQDSIIEYWRPLTMVNIDNHYRFGLVSVPLEDLKKHIMQDEFMGWNDFESYHRWYTAENPQNHMPDHDVTLPLWPVMLSQMDSETLEDGWHRFHCYVKKGVQQIPCIYVATLSIEEP